MYWTNFLSKYKVKSLSRTIETKSGFYYIFAQWSECISVGSYFQTEAVLIVFFLPVLEGRLYWDRALCYHCNTVHMRCTLLQDSMPMYGCTLEVTHVIVDIYYDGVSFTNLLKWHQLCILSEHIWYLNDTLKLVLKAASG